jgi:hypothetical protein
MQLAPSNPTETAKERIEEEVVIGELFLYSKLVPVWYSGTAPWIQSTSFGGGIENRPQGLPRRCCCVAIF